MVSTRTGAQRYIIRSILIDFQYFTGQLLSEMMWFGKQSCSVQEVVSDHLQSFLLTITALGVPQPKFQLWSCSVLN